jgi:hypothetical protein
MLTAWQSRDFVLRSIEMAEDKTPLTMRMRKFSALVAGGQKPKEAAENSGYPAKTAMKTAKALMSCDGVQREIDIQMAELGLDERFFAENLKELIKAEVKDKDGKIGIDFNARGKGLIIFKDIKGLDAPKKTETTHISFEARLLEIANVSDLSDDEIQALDADFIELIGEVHEDSSSDK